MWAPPQCDRCPEMARWIFQMRWTEAYACDQHRYAVWHRLYENKILVYEEKEAWWA